MSGTRTKTQDNPQPRGCWRLMWAAHRSARLSFQTLRWLLLTVVVVSALFFDRIAHPVYPGQRGVKWIRFSGGTVLDRSYPEGMHFTFPWDRFIVYDVRIQEISLTSTIYAQDGLAIKVTCSVRFRPTASYLPRLHQDLGPDYVDKVVRPEIISSLRKVLGNYDPAEIYAKDEQGLLDELGTTLRDDLNSKYFTVNEFLVTELELPQQLQQAIQRKLTEEQNELAYRFVLKREQQEKQRRIIEAEGLRRFEQISGLSVFTWRGLDVTERLATSTNAKVILMGTGADQLPVILNADSGPPPGPVPPGPVPPGPDRADAKPANPSNGSDAGASPESHLGPSLPFIPNPQPTSDGNGASVDPNRPAGPRLGPSLPFVPNQPSDTVGRGPQRAPDTAESNRTARPR